MKQAIINQPDLKQFMRKDQYLEFIKYLRKENKIPEEKAIWIVAQWDVGKF